MFSIEKRSGSQENEGNVSLSLSQRSPPPENHVQENAQNQEDEYGKEKEKQYVQEESLQLFKRVIKLN